MVLLLYLVLAILFLVLLFCLIFAWAVLRAAFGNRQEGSPYLNYFTAADFENLAAEAVEFPNRRGETLRGNLYFESGRTDFRALLIFAHGMGGGHLSYTTELDFFAKQGFLVLAYDATGTMASDGKSLRGFGQSVSDLQSALAFAAQDEKTRALPVVLCGHSWGAYAVCRAQSPAVRGVVAFSAPEDAAALLCAQASAQTGAPFGALKPFLRLWERLRFGKTAAAQTSKVLRTANVPVLLLHGGKDAVVPLSNAAANAPHLSENPHIKRVIYPEKRHNVYNTQEAEAGVAEMLERFGVLSKQKDGGADALAAYAKTLNFRKLCEEDPAVMQTVEQFLEERLLDQQA